MATDGDDGRSGGHDEPIVPTADLGRAEAEVPAHLPCGSERGSPEMTSLVKTGVTNR
jgi:hypothetical protein